MKFLLDQRLKHRLIGVIVIASVAAVFLPAMMKQSNYRFDQSTSVSIRLPPKPIAPQIKVKDEKNMFASIQTAQVNIKTVKETVQLPPEIHAQPIQSIAQSQPLLAKPELIAKPAVSSVAAAKTKPKSQMLAKSVKKELQRVVSKSAKNEVYSVQLASFSQQHNAKSLVTQLRSKGYKASYTKFKGKHGEIYKVVVGGAKHRDEAVSLQKKLASSLQLNGFIVKTGVS